MKWFAAALVALCAACASKPAVNTSQAQSRLAEAEARAAVLVRSGDLGGAARQYDEAVRIAASVENVDAVAANSVNLSIVYQWLGRDAEAREVLARMLDDPRRAFSERRRLQAELRRAIVELALQNTDAAATWVERAARRCPDFACEYAATILNLQAQVALAASRPADAARLASSAAERARARGDRSEAANALRALGRARRAQGEPSAAIPVLEQALALDRELADPRKILADLTELSLASSAAGDRQAARDYYERALAVSRAVQDVHGIAEMEAQLRRP
ncbi:MAG TPA: tetratricopeptide repeat protein [Burkholderiales bacterium]|nr:tetratricopeptide repeat protein [Burkholderiales bacterium]